jgi:formate hydrogenlyase subunit 3/multisubunit Na+/H+ antiporter MnhD subunit
MDTYFAFRLFLPVAFGCFACGMLWSILRGRKTSNLICSALMFSGCLYLIVPSIMCYPQHVEFRTPLNFGGLAPLVLTLDPLASMFLVLLGAVGCAAAMFSPGYLHHLKGRFHHGIYWFSIFAFVLSMALVILVNNAVTFILFWELMALSSVVLVLTDHMSQHSRNAALIYLGATRISTSFLLTGFVWLHALTGSWRFVDWQANNPEFVWPFLTILLGLCIKAGIWPFHLWLPYAHPEAPAPVSALMSGIMVKIAVYAMLRLFASAATPLLPVAYTAIALGVVSSFWGILFALMERNLKRLLAYSTVENIGLIVLSLGLTLLAKSEGLTLVGSIAIAAVLFHCINHAAYKSMLFLCAGSVDAAAHSKDLNQLGGLIKRMKWTSTMFFVGALSICALPPLNGFASKWLVYQGIFQFVMCDGRNPLVRAAALAVIGLLSMVGALSIAAFSKAFGLGFLGRARSHSAHLAVEPSKATVCAQLLLATPCVVLGLMAPEAIQLLTPIAAKIIPGYQAASVFPLPQSELFAVLAVLIPLAYAVTLAGNNPRVKRYLTWDCGYGSLSARSLIAPSSYSRPLADLFRPILQYKVTSQIEGRDRRHFPELITVEAKTISLIANLIYLPAMRAVDAAGRGLIRLQTGSIHIHLLYVFATLLILVIVGTHL